MNGLPFKRGLFAGSMRRYLFSEHLGLIEPAQTESEGVFTTGSQDSIDNAKLKSAGLTSYFPNFDKTRLTLKDIIDSMFLGKINVFHWHIVDDDSWPMVIPTIP